MNEYITFTEAQKGKINFKISETDEASVRIIREINIVLRNSVFVRKIKNKYNNTCQICETRLAIEENIFIQKYII